MKVSEPTQRDKESLAFVFPQQEDGDFRQVRTWAAVSQTPVFCC